MADRRHARRSLDRSRGDGRHRPLGRRALPRHRGGGARSARPVGPRQADTSARQGRLVSSKARRRRFGASRLRGPGDDRGSFPRRSADPDIHVDVHAARGRCLLGRRRDTDDRVPQPRPPSRRAQGAAGALEAADDRRPAPAAGAHDADRPHARLVPRLRRRRSLATGSAGARDAAHRRCAAADRSRRHDRHPRGDADLVRAAGRRRKRHAELRRRDRAARGRRREADGAPDGPRGFCVVAAQPRQAGAAYGYRDDRWRTAAAGTRRLSSAGTRPGRGWPRFSHGRQWRAGVLPGRGLDAGRSSGPFRRTGTCFPVRSIKRGKPA